MEHGLNTDNKNGNRLITMPHQTLVYQDRVPTCCSLIRV